MISCIFMFSKNFRENLILYFKMSSNIKDDFYLNRNVTSVADLSSIELLNIIIILMKQNNDIKKNLNETHIINIANVITNNNLCGHDICGDDGKTKFKDILKLSKIGGGPVGRLYLRLFDKNGDQIIDLKQFYRKSNDDINDIYIPSKVSDDNLDSKDNDFGSSIVKSMKNVIDISDNECGVILKNIEEHNINKDTFLSFQSKQDQRKLIHGLLPERFQLFKSTSSCNILTDYYQQNMDTDDNGSNIKRDFYLDNHIIKIEQLNPVQLLNVIVVLLTKNEPGFNKTLLPAVEENILNHNLCGNDICNTQGKLKCKKALCPPLKGGVFSRLYGRMFTKNAGKYKQIIDLSQFYKDDESESTDTEFDSKIDDSITMESWKQDKFVLDPMKDQIIDLDAKELYNVICVILLDINLKTPMTPEKYMELQQIFYENNINGINFVNKGKQNFVELIRNPIKRGPAVRVYNRLLIYNLSDLHEFDPNKYYKSLHEWSKMDLFKAIKWIIMNNDKITVDLNIVETRLKEIIKNDVDISEMVNMFDKDGRKYFQSKVSSIMKNGTSSKIYREIIKYNSVKVSKIHLPNSKATIQDLNSNELINVIYYVEDHVILNPMNESDLIQIERIIIRDKLAGNIVNIRDSFLEYFKDIHNDTGLDSLFDALNEIDLSIFHQSKTLAQMCNDAFNTVSDKLDHQLLQAFKVIRDRPVTGKNIIHYHKSGKDKYLGLWKYIKLEHYTGFGLFVFNDITVNIDKLRFKNIDEHKVIDYLKHIKMKYAYEFAKMFNELEINGKIYNKLGTLGVMKQLKSRKLIVRDGESGILFQLKGNGNETPYINWSDVEHRTFDINDSDIHVQPRLSLRFPNDTSGEIYIRNSCLRGRKKAKISWALFAIKARDLYKETFGKQLQESFKKWDNFDLDRIMGYYDTGKISDRITFYQFLYIIEAEHEIYYHLKDAGKCIDFYYELYYMIFYDYDYSVWIKNCFKLKKSKYIRNWLKNYEMDYLYSCFIVSEMDENVFKILSYSDWKQLLPFIRGNKRKQYCNALYKYCKSLNGKKKVNSNNSLWKLIKQPFKPQFGTNISGSEDDIKVDSDNTPTLESYVDDLLKFEVTKDDRDNVEDSLKVLQCHDELWNDDKIYGDWLTLSINNGEHFESIYLMLVDQFMIYYMDKYGNSKESCTISDWVNDTFGNLSNQNREFIEAGIDGFFKATYKPIALPSSNTIHDDINVFGNFTVNAFKFVSQRIKTNCFPIQVYPYIL